MIGRLFYLMIIGVLLFTVDGLGQNTWVKTYGGSGDDQGYSITKSEDGGYVLAGNTLSFDGDLNIAPGGVVVMKLNLNGNIVWKKTFGYSIPGGFELNRIHGDGFSISNTNTGGYFLTGWFQSDFIDLVSKGRDDIFVLKLDSNGETDWKKSFGGSAIDKGYAITTSDDNGCVLSGWSISNDNDFNGMSKGRFDIFVLKLDKNGDTVWKRIIGGSDNEGGSSITNTKDGGFVITGKTSSTDGDFKGRINDGIEDIFILKLNSIGDIVWKKTYGGSGGERGNTIISTKDNGFVLIGDTYSNDGDFSGMNKGKIGDYYSEDVFVMKLDSIGNIQWKKTIGGSGSDYGNSIISNSDSVYYLTGTTNSNDGDFSNMCRDSNVIFLIGLDRNGNIIQKRTYGGKSLEIARSLTSVVNGGVILAGYTGSNDEDFSGLNKGKFDIFVMKLDSNGNLNNTTSINEFSEPTTTLSVHPNPFSNSTTISYKVNTPSNVRIELLNTLGQTIEVLREDYTDIGTYKLPLNTSTLSSGMYSVRMRSGSMNEVVPVWVVR